MTLWPASPEIDEAVAALEPTQPSEKEADRWWEMLSSLDAAIRESKDAEKKAFDNLVSMCGKRAGYKLALFRSGASMEEASRKADERFSAAINLAGANHRSIRQLNHMGKEAHDALWARCVATSGLAKKDNHVLRSEHLGLAVPDPGGVVRGTTFAHYIPMNVVLEVRKTPVGKEFSYRESDGLEWTVMVHESEFEFINRWDNGSRSFRVERELL